MALGYATTLAIIFITTAVAWMWPNASDWVFGGIAILAGVFLFFVWRAARKQEALGKEGRQLDRNSS